MKEEKYTLEGILELCGEMKHMEELLLYRSRKKKGASADEILNEVVNPTLEDFMFYLKYYMTDNIDKAELKRMVSGWIDAQMKKN
ncbi:hypothetical protein F1737_00405 [Methanoplanus sp. FWC-SCC4]|uniref:Uncharacterized protein n=1 Tax=Methanochimaera problematica TaxID=2609417 RepID=A0AA97FD29_9EURY|nr:hypothetical protein [Methanoplanus sp. FWC-SCC4]WOF15246.1 hypothetical protein F1737_00405 [Methanoplanus sp. FWC-SCC4]